MDMSSEAAWNRRLGRHYDGLDSRERVQWTAAKCHRLLRPIQLQIKAIRSLADSGESGVTSGPTRSHQPSCKLASRKRAGTGEGNQNAKRSRVTYSLRRRRPVRPSSPEFSSSNTETTPPRKIQCASKRPKTPGSLLVPSSIIRKMRVGHQGQMEDQQQSPCQDLGQLANKSTGCKDESSSGQNQLTREQRRLQDKLHQSHWPANNGLLKAFDSLCHQTSSTGPRRGKKSLTSMCMRRAPQLVAQLEAMQEEEAERLREVSTLDAPNVSFEMYSELEGFPGLGPGRRLLSEMVRSQAVGSIRLAIENGGILPAVSSFMVYLGSERHKCFDSALGILESVLALHLAQDPSHSSHDEKTGNFALIFAVKFCNQHDRWNSLFSILDRLIRENVISHHWLGRKEFLPIWQGLTKVLAACTSSPGATMFATSALSALMDVSEQPRAREGLPDPMASSPRRQILVQVASAMVAIGYLTGDEVVRGRILLVLEETLSKWWAKGSLRESLPAHVLAVGITIASKGQSQTGLELLKASQVGDREYDSVVSLVCGVSRLCGRDAPTPSHEILKAVCETLVGIEFASRSTTNLMADGAFLLAQKTGDLRDLSFAENLPSRGSERKQQGDMPEQSDALFSGYRWDEGISEWVVRSPIEETREDQPKQLRPRPIPTSPSLKVRVSRLRLVAKAKEPAKRKLPLLPAEPRGLRRREPLLPVRAKENTKRNTATETRGKKDVRIVSIPEAPLQRRVVWDVDVASDDELW